LRNKAKDKTKVLILGVGNILLKDEGIGSYVVEKLKDEELPIKVKLIDAGTQILDTLLSQEAVEKLIIVDALRAEGIPGAIYKFKPEDIKEETGLKLSLHQATVIEALKILEFQNRLPRETVIFGIEPKSIEWGLEPTDELKAKTPELIKLIKEEVKC